MHIMCNHNTPNFISSFLFFNKFIKNHIEDIIFSSLLSFEIRDYYFDLFSSDIYFDHVLLKQGWKQRSPNLFPVSQKPDCVLFWSFLFPCFELAYQCFHLTFFLKKKKRRQKKRRSRPANHWTGRITGFFPVQTRFLRVFPGSLAKRLCASTGPDSGPVHGSTGPTGRSGFNNLVYNDFVILTI
jgi:hypothetical protein